MVQCSSNHDHISCKWYGEFWYVRQISHKIH